MYPVIILFDGVCSLCNSTINFIIDKDKKDIFRFASLQSKFGQQFLVENHLPEAIFSSMYVVVGKKVYEKSDAIIQILKRLKWYSILGYFFQLIPKFIRDKAYVTVAKNRYKIFGKENQCRIPTKELVAKFID